MEQARKRQPWWTTVERRVERGLSLAESCDDEAAGDGLRVGRRPQTLYNLMQTTPEFRALVDAARLRYHHSLVNAIERVSAGELEPIMSDLRELRRLELPARTLARQRSIRTLDAMLGHHVREAEKIDGRGELGKSEVTVRHAPISDEEWAELEAELDADLRAQAGAGGEIADTEVDADPADLDDAIDP